MMSVHAVTTRPFADQKPGTVGLRKLVAALEPLASAARVIAHSNELTDIELPTSVT